MLRACSGPGVFGSFFSSLAQLLGPVGLSTFAFAAWKDPPRLGEHRTGMPGRGLPEDLPRIFHEAEQKRTGLLQV